MPEAQDDDLVITLVEMALARPVDEREACLRGACSGDTELFSQAWSYVQSEQRMNGFLLDPLYTPASGEHPFESGQLLENRFRIVREVAQGGMGIVYEAIDEKLQRRTALKCGKVGFRKRLPPEVRNATAISHPNVCKTFEIHTALTAQGEIDFLTMEFLDGETLAGRLSLGPLPEQEARTIAGQLCAGLAEAHRNLVIHGDLKSNNIILTKAADGAIRAVITDFGLARRPDAAQTGEIGGTPDYMAPELWSGQEASVASDIYALGVILYELASGRRPYGPEVSRQERLTRKPPSVNPKWDRILARCVDPDPARRFQSADEVALALAPPRSRRWLLGTAAATILTVGAGVTAYERATAPQRSGRLAVIPFVNASATPESAYLSDGISDGLINALVRLPELNVIARSSSFKFKGDSSDVRSAAKTLGAQTIVTGRVDGINGQFRITAELVNGADGRQIWGAQYSAGVSDLANVQLQIARQIAERISSKLTPMDQMKLAKGMTVSPEAYELLLRGRYQIGLYTPESKQRAIGYYEQALAIDPHFGLANAELASAYRLSSSSGVLSSADALPRAEAAALRALAADPDLAEAHGSLAGVKKDQWDWATAEREYRRALQLSPNLVFAHEGLAICLSVTRRYEAAMAEVQRARDLDPIGLPGAIAAVAVDYNSRRYDEALAVLKQATALDPSSSSVWTWTGIVNGGSGRFAEARAAYEHGIALGDKTAATQCFYAYTLARSGARDRALQILERIRRSEEFVPRSAVAVLYAGLDQKERAIQSLLAAYAAKDPLLQYMNVESHFDILRNDPRFQDLAGKMGLPR